MMKRSISILLALVLSLGMLCVLPASAEYSALTVTTSAAGYQSLAFPMTSTLSTARWSHLMFAYQFQTSDTTFVTVNYSIKDKNMVVCFDTYDIKTCKLLSTKTVPMELSVWAGAHYDGSHYYLAFSNSDNPSQDTNKEMLRVVKYDKNFRRVGAVNCGDGWATDMCHSGSLRMDSYGTDLMVYTCRERYDGHQSNILFWIDTSDMELLNYNGTGPFPGVHVSHSFNQYVRFADDGVLYLSDHGDGYPRGIAAQAHDLTEDLPFHVSGHLSPMYVVPGEIGANCTGITYGGFELSNTAGNMLAAINTIDHSKVSSYTSFTMNGLGRDERNAVLLVAPMDGSYERGGAKQVTFTNYIGTGNLASTPYLVKINDDRFMFMWEAFQYTSYSAAKSLGVRYVYVDGNGRALSSIEKLPDARLSCSNEPKLIGDEVIWFLNSDTEVTRTFYRIDINHGKLKQTVSVSMPERVTYGDAPFKITTAADRSSKLTNFNYASDNPAVASVAADGTVTVNGAGTANITVTQPGNDNYVAAVVTKKLTVSKVRIDIHPEDAIKAVGDADPTFAYTYSGTVIDDAQFTGALTRVKGEEPGTYGIRRGTLSLGANYVLNVQGGTLYIVDEVKAPTVTTEVLPVACVGEAYRAELTADAPLDVTWELISGTLPAGLTFENGVISGTPTAEGTGTLTVRAANPMLPAAEGQFTLAVHSFGDPVVTQAPTCTVAGVAVRTCSVCRKTEEQVLAPLGTAEQPYEGCLSAKFTDVAYGDWFHEAVDFARANSLMNGTSDTTFTPSAKISRSMIAQVLYNREGRPTLSAESAYTDVTPDKWYYDAMRWAASNALILDGDGDGIIGADSEITREEIALILWRYFDRPQSVHALDAFADTDAITADGLPAFRWAVEVGIFRGNDASCLNPQNTAMRSEAAQIFMNLFKKFDYK